MNRTIEVLLGAETSSASSWPARRIWQAWSRGPIRDIPLLSKVEVLTDKGCSDCATIKQHYDGRNAIAHGGSREVQFFVPQVARTLNDIVGRFVIS